MLKHGLQPYLDYAAEDCDIAVAIYSIETGDEIAVSYDLVIDINEFGEMMICVAI